MAQPSTELNTFRSRVTSLLNDMNKLSGALSVIEGSGIDDTERIAFFSSVLTAEYDIDSTELGDAIIKLRDLETWLDTNLPILAKMRI